ncbi:addiction module antidote protein [Brucella tritici]|jgi:probable addiction module antidote protein
MEGITTMEVQFRRYDAANYLRTEDDIAAYIEAVMEDGDPALIAAALGDVARARNLSQLAREVGMSRQGLDKALSGNGNPSLATVMKVANALGLRLSLKPIHTGEPTPALKP